MTQRDCEHGQLARSCLICELQAEIAALKAKLAAVCEAGEAHPPLMVMLAVEILCNHVEPGWENSQSVVWAWIAEERAKRNALVSAREVK